jgi:hypothetical protein
MTPAVAAAVAVAASVVVGLVSDQVLATINSVELLGIIYLAIAVSKLRERIAKMEGKGEQRERDNGR